MRGVPRARWAISCAPSGSIGAFSKAALRVTIFVNSLVL